MTICSCFSYFRPDLRRFEVRIELYDGPARSLVFLTCLRLTPRRHRQAIGQLSSLYSPLPSFNSFGAACVKLCGLPRWSETPVAAVSSSLKCHKYKVRFDVNMNSPGFSLESHQMEKIFMVDAHESETSMSTFILKAV